MNTLKVLRALLVAMSFVATAHAAPTPAERLHDAAMVAHRSGRLRQAVELWRDALKLERAWKYAYNLANSLYELGDGAASWEALAVVDTLEPPEAKYAPLALELRSKVRALLYKDHALLLPQVPEGATVLYDGKVLQPPYAIWSPTPETTITVSSPGFTTRVIATKTPIGQATELSVVLERVVVAPVVGTLDITSTTDGARVIVAGEEHVLPATLSLPPGRLEVVARARGYVSRTYPVEVVAGVTTPLSLALERVTPTTVSPDLATPGWVSIAAGVALLGAGTGFLVWADGTRDDMRALVRDPAIRVLGYPAYNDRYDELEGDFEGQRLASQIFFVAGGVSIATGIVLVLLDESPSSDTNVQVVPMRGGGAIVGGASF